MLGTLSHGGGVTSLDPNDIVGSHSAQGMQGMQADRGLDEEEIPSMLEEVHCPAADANVHTGMVMSKDNSSDAQIALAPKEAEEFHSIYAHAASNQLDLLEQERDFQYAG